MSCVVSDQILNCEKKLEKQLHLLDSNHNKSCKPFFYELRTRSKIEPALRALPYRCSSSRPRSLSKQPEKNYLLP